MELQEIPGIGAKSLLSLKNAGVSNLSELLHTYPRTYRLFTAGNTSTVKVNDWVALKGTLKKPFSRRTGRLTTQTAVFWDTHGSITLRWFNMPYLVRSLRQNSTYLVKGQVSAFNGRLQLVAPTLTPVADDYALRDLLVPIYRSSGGIKPWILRQKISLALDHLSALPDPLPSQIIDQYHLLDLFTALNNLHRPADFPSLNLAIRRFSFEELFNLQKKALTAKTSLTRSSVAMPIKPDYLTKFIASLPFPLTPSQLTCIKEILADLAEPITTNRLLQGEVGSGKTIVAVAAATVAYLAGERTIVMAPTQILALQLYENFVELTTGFGPTVSLITARSRGVPTSDIVVGTQALLNNLDLGDYGLVIIDEQHRFGVNARQALTKRQLSPHLLQMTATPIPRTAAQTLLGHLAISRLTDLPAGRLPTKSYLVPESKRSAAYTWLKTEIKNNQNQAFIVVPLIELAEESDAPALKSVRELEVTLKEIFPDLALDIMHGRMDESDKTAKILKFKSGQTQILVSTSMIEVGLDIPQANIMIIEDADRFGLAQLHQLRGRVGRGGQQGHCLLFSRSHSSSSLDRLAYFIRETNGDKLARYDLKTRGPGELFGVSQSGFFNLAIGNMYDEKLLQETYQAAKTALSLDNLAGNN